MMTKSFVCPVLFEDRVGEQVILWMANDLFSSHTHNKNNPQNTITECVKAMHSVCSQWFLSGTNHTTVRLNRIMHKE